MKEIQIAELRELQMQILDYVDAFCRKHDIKYTISGGTLLGAVRHGGYIPWDDDMDIQMLRAEYERFTQLWNKEKPNHGHFELVNIESGNNMGYPFGKVHDTRTVTYIDAIERTGVFIDIFPVDGVRDIKDWTFRHSKIKALYHKRSLIFEKLKSENNRISIKKRLYLFLFAPHQSYQQIAVEIDNIAKSPNDIIYPYVFELISGMKCKYPIPGRVFQHYSDIEFENRHYMSVEDYDTYLKATFDDYMSPPPIEKQQKQHLFRPFWK